MILCYNKRHEQYSGADKEPDDDRGVPGIGIAGKIQGDDKERKPSY